MPLSYARLFAVCFACCTALRSLGACEAEPPERSPEPTATADDPPSSQAPAAPPWPARPRWLLIGGGADPVSNPISLAQDLQHLARSLPGKGATLFASGPGAQVAVTRPQPSAPRAEELRKVLARLLAPAGYPELEYQPSPLTPAGPATRERVLRALHESVTAGDAPLLLYLAGHGEQGEQPASNRFLLWGGDALTAAELARALDEASATRSVRLVNTACFGGGFADFVFEGGEPGSALASPVRCGLFAAPWDDEASGCDPNPDRRSQESYALHLVRALSGAAEAADLDGDGSVGLLDAHVHAALTSGSFDIPTTSSERWLRLHAVDEAVAGDALRGASLLREEKHLVDHLGGVLSLDDPVQAQTRLVAIEARMQQLDEQLVKAQTVADARYYDLRIALLERWPLLEHPWRAQFDALLREQGPAILKLARDSSRAKAYANATGAMDAPAQTYDRLRVERARVLRLLRAHESLELAGALLRLKPSTLGPLRALRQCERGRP